MKRASISFQRLEPPLTNNADASLTMNGDGDSFRELSRSVSAVPPSWPCPCIRLGLWRISIDKPLLDQLATRTLLVLRLPAVADQGAASPYTWQQLRQLHYNAFTAAGQHRETQLAAGWPQPFLRNLKEQKLFSF